MIADNDNECNSENNYEPKFEFRNLRKKERLTETKEIIGVS